jgi:hypothetical protein
MKKQLVRADWAKSFAIASSPRGGRGVIYAKKEYAHYESLRKT